MSKAVISTGKMVRMAVLVAILLLMEITGLGMIKTFGIEMTIMQIPVIIGAIILGPAEGAILGGVFGLLSFWECFGKSVFGGMLLSISPIGTLVVCLVPRILMGWLCGLIFKAMYNPERKKNIFPFAVASLSGALLNTIFFMTALMLIFGSTDYIMGFRGDMNIIPFIVAFVGLQGLIEALLCFVVGAAVSTALRIYLPVKQKNKGV